MIQSLLIESFAQSRGAVIHHHDGEHDQEHKHDGLVPNPISCQLKESLTNSASSNQADDRRHTNIDVPTVDREREIGVNNLRHDTVEDDLKPARAGRSNRLNGPWIDRLQTFGMDIREYMEELMGS
jgi:hypothetical protein